MNSVTDINQLQDFDGPEWLPRLLAEAPRWVALALIVVIAWQLSTIVWALVAGGGSAGVDVADVASPTRTEAASREIDTDTIVNAHLFGVADASAPEPVATPDVVPVSNLSLKLKGTLAADDPEQSIAIIADSSNNEKVYAIRDTVAAGTTLHAVETQRVILNQSGRLTALQLPREFESQPQRRTARTAPARTAAATPARTQAAAGGSIRDAITENITSLTDIIRPQPYFRGGQQLGYRVYPGKNRALFSQLGLRPGDLVTEINGTPMTDPRQGMQIFRSLGDATSVTVTIERDGQSQSLNLSTDQLTTES